MDLVPWLPSINLIHVLAAFGFVFVHGVSGLLSLRVRGERDRERIKTMTELSGSFIGWGWITLSVPRSRRGPVRGRRGLVDKRSPLDTGHRSWSWSSWPAS